MSDKSVWHRFIIYRLRTATQYCPGNTCFKYKKSIVFVCIWKKLHVFSDIDFCDVNMLEYEFLVLRMQCRFKDFCCIKNLGHKFSWILSLLSVKLKDWNPRSVHGSFSWYHNYLRLDCYCDSKGCLEFHAHPLWISELLQYTWYA